MKNIEDCISESDVSIACDKIYEKMKELRVTSCSGGDFVKLTLDGLGRIISLTCEDSPLIKDDIPMLMDLVKAAYNSAREKMDEEIRRRNECFEFV